MKRLFCCAFVIGLTFFDVSFAATVPAPEIKQVIAFVFVQKKDGKWDAKGNWEPNGTAFFTSVRSVTKPDQVYPYIVTAKHVLQYQADQKKPNSKEWFPTIKLRLNTKNGSVDFVDVPIVPSGDKKTVFLHPEDSTVDLAVIPGKPADERFEFKFLPDSMVTTEKDFRNLGIAEGSEIFFAGLFTPYLGTRRNYPVIRFGRVALVTDEKIQFLGLESNLYLIESGSYGGNSGSPVFFYLGSDRQPGNLVLGPPVIKLAGIMYGSFLDIQPILFVETAQTPIARSNMGIAAVTPAYKLHEILFGTELAQRRD